MKEIKLNYEQVDKIPEPTAGKYNVSKTTMELIEKFRFLEVNNVLKIVITEYDSNKHVSVISRLNTAFNHHKPKKFTVHRRGHDLYVKRIE